ncbi:HMG (high mobility group) box protein [Ceratobasidium sp. AG-Ba]|nr:HMG (high mobility group) box protein [Ceratobasidium sp. AG-Ba]QRW08466.1 HMG (high mobility group) box protein [Ceratobasidium sp. AG-Ba]
MSASNLAEPVPAHADDDGLEDTSDNDALIAQALNPDGTPRRPMNAFMIFARRRRPEITANNPPLRTGEISKVLSSEWAAMSADSKQFYLDRARKLKDNFNARWPDYVYRRRPNNTRKRKRPDGASTSGPPVVRRCASTGREPIVPSSKVKYEDGYQHPCLPSVPSGTGAPLTMMYLGEAGHGRPNILDGYSSSSLPSLLSGPYSRGGGTPSLTSSILTSASASPRSVSSTLHSSFRYGDLPLGGSPRDQAPSKMARMLEGPSFPPSNAAFNSPYGGPSYLPKTNAGSFDDYSRAPDQEPSHGDWTPPHGARTNLSLPPFQNYAYDSTPEEPSAGFPSYPASESQLEYGGGLVPVHPHFQR